MESKIRILVVDGNESGAELAEDILKKLGASHVKGVLTGGDALYELENKRYDIVVSEYDLPDMSGIDLHKKILERNNDIPFILFISPAGTDIINEAFNSRFDFTLKKTGDPIVVYSDLCQKIRQTVQLYRTENKLKLYTEELEETVKARTRELKMAHRFSVIGELATMIGHDMRNPLQVITNMEYLAKRRINEMSDSDFGVLERYGINTILSTIESETLYLNKIVSDLQDYARDISLDLSFIDVRQFFLEFQPLFAMNEMITYDIRIEEGMQIFADKELMKRVFSNLIANGISAITHEGNLQIKAGIDEDNAIIQVSDTGKGITDDISNKIFDPLFTTRAKGTGFGLPVAKRLIEAHHGTIQLKSVIGKGTIVTVKLPRNPIKEEKSFSNKGG